MLSCCYINGEMVYNSLCVSKKQARGSLQNSVASSFLHSDCSKPGPHQAVRKHVERANMHSVLTAAD